MQIYEFFAAVTVVASIRQHLDKASLQGNKEAPLDKGAEVHMRKIQILDKIRIPYRIQNILSNYFGTLLNFILQLKIRQSFHSIKLFFIDTSSYKHQDVNNPHLDKLQHPIINGRYPV
ncbi:hypothetical protein [Pseudocnuella soli]|uniref:hypothetical protein n=1 Tax=Pseudocnuella soli TaxID=2502779 RepID=UPI00104B310C|nr:hypothetical protein [Pseudocnuella soli]